MATDPSRRFSLSYDGTTKAVSAVVCALPLVAGIAAHSVLAAGLGLACVLLAYAWSPRGYVVAERAITIRRLIGDARVPLERVREARRANAGDFRGCIRWWGSGGLFGYYGLFRTSALGKCTWYVTDRSRAVVVATHSKTALFSPDNVDGFLDAIRAEVPVPAADKIDPLTAPPGPNVSGIVAAIAVAVVVTALVAGVLLYSPGLPRCTLTSQALTIHDRFYPVTLPASAVDVEHIRVVDITASEWWPVARINGFANARYRCGWFRVAGGAKVRMYRCASRRLVLIPPRGDGAPVLLEARDPEQFAREMREAWSTSPPRSAGPARR
jgi:hypothetical protein